MTTDELVPAFLRVHATLTTSRAATVLEPLRPYATRPKPDVQALLHVFAALSSGYAQFTEAERALLAALGLQAITDTAWWAALITACTRTTMNHESAAMIEGLHARLTVAGDSLPALAKLLGMPGATQPAPSTAAMANGIVLVFSGLDGAPPALTRVAGAIEGMDQLWGVAEDLTGQRGPLRLRGMDGSPTLTLHFSGLPEPVEELRSLLFSIRDQTARLSHLPVEQHAVLLPDMLPVMQRIGQSSRADAMRLRLAIEGGVRRLLEAGCALPSRRADAGFPNATAVPQAKPAITDEAADDDGHLAAVIAEERSQLRPAEPQRRLWQGVTTSQTV